ncbi:uncharacterized protein LOC136083143 [Hydra vulgaris]|uniref:Uncharacterized protein LOC136083143 n=1 Tax=Hydra vulgaris TaxID=6087 RepID=A0ABM4CAE6_HYDVU
MSDIDFGLNRKDVFIVVENYLKESNQRSLFKDGKPTRKWYSGFMNKYRKEICPRKVSGMQTIRAVATQPAIIDNWFEQLAVAYNEHNLGDKLFQIFNCAESGLQFDQGKVKIICKKGTKNPEKLAPSNEKQMTTILTCFNSFGNYLPHQIIYKGKHVMKDWCKGGAQNVYYNSSSSGWMESEHFLSWFKTVFLPHANKLSGFKVLKLDGHISHMSLELKKKALENSILLWGLPAHTSHFLQPLDVGVFKTVKGAWKRIVESYLTKNHSQSLTNRHFPAMFKDLIQNGGFKPENARSGFKNTGIFPLDRLQISSKKTSIGAVFQAVENNIIENLFDSSTVSSPLVTGNATNTPNTPSRMSNREFLLKSFATLNNAVQQVGKDINKSVLNMLRDQLTPTLNKRVQKSERIKRPANMTSADAIAYDEAEQASKKQKLDEQAAKKFTREQKRFPLLLKKRKMHRKEKKKKS